MKVLLFSMAITSLTHADLRRSASSSSSSSSEESAYYCPPHWTLFNRIKGAWCIRVFNATLNRYEAQEKCEEHSATLTGLENKHERKFVHKRGLTFIRPLNLTEGNLWIGMKRRDACQGEDRMNSTGCVPWVPHAFEWTDRFTTGSKMMHFRPGEPDDYENIQNYIYMYIIDGLVGQVGATPGSLSDVQGWASNSTIPLECVRGYACGKPAQPYKN